MRLLFSGYAKFSVWNAENLPASEGFAPLDLTRASFCTHWRAQGGPQTLLHLICFHNKKALATPLDTTKSLLSTNY